MDDEERFTNRHGHTVAALKETVDSLPEPEYKTAVLAPPKRRKRVKFHLSPHAVRVCLIVLAVLLLTPVAAGEYVRASYGNNVASAKSTVSAQLSAAVSGQSSGTTSKLLFEADQQLSRVRDGLCPGGFLDNMAKLYPRAQAAYDECAAYRSSVTALEEHVRVAAEEMAYLEKLQPLLESVAKPLDDQFAVLSAQQEIWQQFVEGLGQLSAPASFSSSHNSLLQHATAIRDQWIALVQATGAQESAKFRDARTKLTDSFTAFRGQTASFSTAVSTSQTSLSVAASSL